MRDIELVIKIPEEIYQHYRKIWQKRRGSVPESCIAFGTPLPEYHGRLIDAEILRNQISNLAGFDILGRIVDEQETIINGSDKMEAEK